MIIGLKKDLVVNLQLIQFTTKKIRQKYLI